MPTPRAPRRFKIKRHPIWHVCAQCGGASAIDEPMRYDGHVAAVVAAVVTCDRCNGRGEVRAPEVRAPWVMRDASRPAFLGHYATHALALAAVNAKLRAERGAPIVDISVAEIREAMTKAEDRVDPIAAFGAELRRKYGDEPGMVAIGSTR